MILSKEFCFQTWMIATIRTCLERSIPPPRVVGAGLRGPSAERRRKSQSRRRPDQSIPAIGHANRRARYQTAQDFSAAPRLRPTRYRARNRVHRNIHRCRSDAPKVSQYIDRPNLVSELETGGDHGIFPGLRRRAALETAAGPGRNPDSAAAALLSAYRVALSRTRCSSALNRRLSAQKSITSP